MYLSRAYDGLFVDLHIFVHDQYETDTRSKSIFFDIAQGLCNKMENLRIENQTVYPYFSCLIF